MQALSLPLELPQTRSARSLFRPPSSLGLPDRFGHPPQKNRFAFLSGLPAPKSGECYRASLLSQEPRKPLSA